jgi:hypothetical protein
MPPLERLIQSAPATVHCPAAGRAAWTESAELPYETPRSHYVCIKCPGTLTRATLSSRRTILHRSRAVGMGGVLEGLAFDPPGGERPAAEDEREVFGVAAQRRS